MKILIEESVLRQVLDALELSKPTMVCAYQDSDTRYATKKSNEAITTLRSALDAAKCQRERDSLLELKPNADMRELCAACQMALDALESCINDPKMRHTDTVHYDIDAAHAKLREVLK